LAPFSNHTYGAACVYCHYNAHHTSSRRQWIFGTEALLEIHFWTSSATSMPAFSIIVNLLTHWTVQMYMSALFVTVKKTSVLVPRKVNEAWGSLSGSFITMNEVAFLYHRETKNIQDIIATVLLTLKVAVKIDSYN
jgi:hypothetical protein